LGKGKSLDGELQPSGKAREGKQRPEIKVNRQIRDREYPRGGVEKRKKKNGVGAGPTKKGL